MLSCWSEATLSSNSQHKDKRPKTKDNRKSFNHNLLWLDYLLYGLVIRVDKFSSGVYKIGKIFAVCIPTYGMYTYGMYTYNANILLVKKATFPYLLFPILFQCIKSSKNNVKLILEWFLKLPYSMVVSTSIM